MRIDQMGKVKGYEREMCVCPSCGLKHVRKRGGKSGH